MASSRQSRSLRAAGRTQTLYSLPRAADEHDHLDGADEEDWVNLADPIAKKRIQNRLAQRAYRKRVKSRLHKLDILQKQFNQLKQRNKSVSALDTLPTHNNMDHCLVKSISPLSMPKESNLPRYNPASPPSTVDEIAMHQVLDPSPTSTNASISSQLHTCNKAAQSQRPLTAFESCFPTHLDGYSVSVDRDPAASSWPPFKPSQPLINCPAEPQEKQTTYHFVDPWNLNVAHEPHPNMTYSPASSQDIIHNLEVTVLDPQLESTDGSREQLRQESALATDKAMGVKNAERHAPSPTLRSGYQEIGAQHMVADLQRLGGLHIIIDTLQATVFTNFDDLVLFYYTGELSWSPRLAHEQRLSQSQRLTSVLHGLAGVQAVLEVSK